MSAAVWLLGPLSYTVLAFAVKRACGQYDSGCYRQYSDHCDPHVTSNVQQILADILSHSPLATPGPAFAAYVRSAVDQGHPSKRWSRATRRASTTSPVAFSMPRCCWHSMSTWEDMATEKEVGPHQRAGSKTLL